MYTYAHTHAHTSAWAASRARGRGRDAAGWPEHPHFLSALGEWLRFVVQRALTLPLSVVFKFCSLDRLNHSHGENTRAMRGVQEAGGEGQGYWPVPVPAARRLAHAAAPARVGASCGCAADGHAGSQAGWRWAGTAGIPCMCACGVRGRPWRPQGALARNRQRAPQPRVARGASRRPACVPRWMGWAARGRGRGRGDRAGALRSTGDAAAALLLRRADRTAAPNSRGRAARRAGVGRARR